jgi:hypothetical protein
MKFTFPPFDCAGERSAQGNGYALRAKADAATITICAIKIQKYGVVDVVTAAFAPCAWCSTACQTITDDFYQVPAHHGRRAIYETAMAGSNFVPLGLSGVGEHIERVSLLNLSKYFVDGVPHVIHFSPLQSSGRTIV